jgi:predicted RNase H-like HicB family nuclease
MDKSMMLEVSVLVRAAPDLSDQWIAHCLNLDIVTQGASPEHAIRQMAEAIVLAVEDDLAHDLDPHGRIAAPEASWQQFWEVLRGGTRISPTDIDNYRESRSLVVAAVLYMKRLNVSRACKTAMHESGGTPDPYIIAAINDGPGAAHR